MILNSIRWRLQIWYGILLVAILAGFGITSYQLERARRFREIDEQLQQKMGVLSRALELNHPGPRPHEGHDDGLPGRPPPPDGPPDSGPPPEERGPRQAPPPDDFALDPNTVAMLGGNGPNAYYYIITRRDGAVLVRSSNVPKYHIYANLQEDPHTPNAIPDSATIKMTNAAKVNFPITRSLPPDSFRELPMMTPPGEFLLVGRSITPDLAELSKFAWSLTGIGFFVLLLGLAGGWVLGTRAIRPIEDISAAAVKIAAGDLAQRIDVEDTENELGRLAGVLNSTFARLEAAFAQQGRFTADAAHELRTPVTVILTQTQMALKQNRDAADYRETIEACQRSAQKMRRLLESLLELARLDAGQEPMRQQRFDLADTVGECVEHVQPLARERHIKIENNSPALECTGDPERLAQVVTNLLTNAIHYNKEQGEVRVTTEAQNGAALVVVSDTGVGISAEDLPHVFERFYRADKSRSSTAGRNGLGLSISKAIVEAHGGNIEVTSQPGKGTTFTVHLPRQTHG